MLDMYLVTMAQCTILGIFIGYDKIGSPIIGQGTWLKYLLVQLADKKKLHLSEKELKIKHWEKNIFQQQATIYNEPPDNI